MKKVIILLLCLSVINVFLGQEVNNKKEAGKEVARRKKEERKAKMEEQFRMTGRILEGRRFVLEAQRLSNERGSQKFVTPVLNFISVDSLHGIIQVGSPERAGNNGVGGVTVDGKISNWKFSKDEKQKTFDLFMTIQSNLGVFDVVMTVDYSGNADADITRLRAGRLTFTGNVVTRENSSVFKGQYR